MYRVSRRTLSVFILIAACVLGMGFYIIRYLVYGGTWVAAPFNSTVFSGGTLITGKVVDRNAVVLADVKDGVRIFAESQDIRRSTLHAVGDKEGNIGTGALRVYAPQLIGYNPIGGAYSFSGSAGNTLTLTIDSRLHTAALRALDGRRGVVMVSNYKTGEIVCMVSSPTFDPVSPPVYVDEEEGMYLNRALQAAYVPGSTFKMITAAAAIENITNIYNRTFECTGEMRLSDDIVTCPSVHGSLGFEQGMRVSCNIVYGTLALDMGAEVLSDYAAKFGLSGRTSVGGINTASGNFTMAAEASADLAWSGVGQYMNLVNPASMLRFVGAVANDGIAMDLFFLKRTGLSSIFPSSSQRLLSRDTAHELAAVIEVQNRANFPGLDIHAKSGTAQVGGNMAPHAWYVGYITNPGFPYAFVVIVENGGGGTANAAPIANRVLQVAKEK